jgi:hypothetical protein
LSYSLSFTYRISNLLFFCLCITKCNKHYLIRVPPWEEPPVCLTQRSICNIACVIACVPSTPRRGVEKMYIRKYDAYIRYMQAAIGAARRARGAHCAVADTYMHTYIHSNSASPQLTSACLPHTAQCYLLNIVNSFQTTARTHSAFAHKHKQNYLHLLHQKHNKNNIVCFCRSTPTLLWASPPMASSSSRLLLLRATLSHSVERPGCQEFMMRAASFRQPPCSVGCSSTKSRACLCIHMYEVCRPYTRTSWRERSEDGGKNNRNTFGY